MKIWNDVFQIITEGKGQIQKQLVLWEHIEQDSKDLSSWLSLTLASLKQPTAGHFDAATAQKSLNDYLVSTLSYEYN